MGGGLAGGGLAGGGLAGGGLAGGWVGEWRVGGGRVAGAWAERAALPCPRPKPPSLPPPPSAAAIKLRFMEGADSIQFTMVALAPPLPEEEA